MPRINRQELPRTEHWRELRSTGDAHREDNDCAVIAIATACGVTYDRAAAALAGCGRKPRKGTPVPVISAAVRALGFEVVNVHKQNIIDGYPQGHRHLKNITTHHPDRFPQCWPAGAYLVLTRRHIGAVVDGVNHDWTRGRAKRVEALFQVVPA